MAKDNADSLSKKVNGIAKKYMERSKENKETGAKTSPDKFQDKVVQLPSCRESERTIPNIIARSALFGVIKRGSRSYKERELIASRDDIKIYYTGKTLDQADCTVWMQALAFASKLGERIKINRSGFLKELGKTTGKKDYEWLDASLTRLMTGVVTVYTKKYHLEFHLIDIWGKFMNEDNPVEYILRVSPEVIHMWANSEYTRVEWDKRLAIRHGNDLASWMQLYVRSNATNGKAHHIGLDKLKNWCGLSKMRLDHFRTGMRKSLSELLRIGEVEEATIRDDDMVIFSRKIEHRDSNTLEHRDSNTLEHRDSNTLEHRDSNTLEHRDSNTLEHRDSNTNYRDSNTNYRDSNTNYRDSNTRHVSKTLIIKDFFRRFFP
jgi:TrfA protein